jgi:flagellar protein FliL
MSQIAATASGAAANPPRRGVLVLAVVAAVFLIATGTVTAYFLGLFGGSGHEGASAAAVAEIAPTVSQSSFLDMPDVLVNLASDQRRPRYLKLKVTLEVANDMVAKQVDALTPRVMDSFQSYLRALRPEDLDGVGAMQRLKDELLARVNFALDPLKVDGVLFKEMLVQ